MSDRTKFDITIGKSTQTMLTKRALAYAVFAEAIRRGVSPERLRNFLPERKLADVDGNLVEHEFIRRAEKAYAVKGRSFDPTRFFTTNSKLIRLRGRTYAFSNQWGTSTLEMVDRMIEEMRATDIRYTACTQ